MTARTVVAAFSAGTVLAAGVAGARTQTTRGPPQHAPRSPLPAPREGSPLPAPREGWQPDPALMADLERRKVPWIFRESEVPAYRLPDPLRCEDGSRVSTSREWERRRRLETLEL